MIVFGITVDEALTGAEYPAGTRVQSIPGGVEIDGCGEAEIASLLPPAVLAVLARAAAQRRYDADIEDLTGPTGRRLISLMGGIELAFYASVLELSEEQIQQANALLSLAAQVRTVAQTRDSALAVIDDALAAGDRAALVEVIG